MGILILKYGGGAMRKHDRKLILQTLKIIYEIQLESIERLLEDEDLDKRSARLRTGKRSRSLVDLVINILTELDQPLHVNQLVEMIKDRYGRTTDRDSVSSALSKKARQGILFEQTGPATFALLKTDKD